MRVFFQHFDLGIGEVVPEAENMDQLDSHFAGAKEPSLFLVRDLFKQTKPFLAAEMSVGLAGGYIGLGLLHCLLVE